MIYKMSHPSFSTSDDVFLYNSDTNYGCCATYSKIDFWIDYISKQYNSSSIYFDINSYMRMAENVNKFKPGSIFILEDKPNKYEYW